MDFAIILKTLRKNKKMTQQQLADILHVDKTSVCKWESGANYPNQNIQIAIAEYFGVSVDYLLGRADEPNPNNQLTNTQPNLLPELLVQLDSLSLEQQEKVVAFIKGLLA